MLKNIFIKVEINVSDNNDTSERVKSLLFLMMKECEEMMLL
jgi:hypothetical protein